MVKSMAVIKPFAALRFDTAAAGPIEKLCCPPYDIISEEALQGYLRESPYNIIRLELPRGEHPYETAAALLNDWKEKGVLKRDDKNSLYIYEEEFFARGETRRVKGVICCVQLEEFEKGVVLPHEETLSKAKADRFELMKATHCNFSQIYSLYMDEEHKTLRRIDALSQRAPDAEMTDRDGVTHRLWVVTDEEAIASIQKDFEDRKLYIADGHHRYETALNFRNYCREQGLAKPGDAVDDIMMMLVDIQHDGLVVFPTHRMIKNLESFDPDTAMKACEKYFTVEQKTGTAAIEGELDALYQQGKKAFAFYAGGENWVLLTLKDMAPLHELLPAQSEALKGLDVTVLHTLVLEKLFGIDKENMANQKNLTYTRSFDEAIEKVRSGEFQCSFILNPTRVTEIRDVAAHGEKMPQKSTYFYPKLITGLVMNSLQD